MRYPIQTPLSLERGKSVFRLVDEKQYIVATMEETDDAVNEEQSAQIIRAVNNHDALVDLLRENLNAWDDEEDSVQEEHAELIERTRKLVNLLTP